MTDFKTDPLRALYEKITELAVEVIHERNEISAFKKRNAAVLKRIRDLHDLIRPTISEAIRATTPRRTRRSARSSGTRHRSCVLESFSRLASCACSR